MSSPQALSLGDPVYVRVREAIRQDIINGVFAGGARLRMAELAQRYAVSAMPIREALQELQGEGLLSIEPNKGARVRSVDASFISNMYDLRGAIDGMLVRRAAEKLTAAQLTKLAEAQIAYEAAVARGRTAAILAENERFHGIISEAAANAEAEAMIARHWGLIEALRSKHGFGKERFTQVIREHRALLKALQKRDGVAAQEIAIEHSEGAKKDLLARMAAR